MKVRIIFKDASAEKEYDADNIYTKGEMLVLRVGDMLVKYPLMNIFSVCHKHGNDHWGSRKHLAECRRADDKDSQGFKNLRRKE